MMTRILYLTQSLGVGGAETQLWHLLAGLDRSRYEPVLAAFQAHGQFRARFEQLNVPIQNLDIRFPLRQRRNIRPILDFSRWLRREQFDLLHAWLFHANVLGSLAGRRAGCRGVILSERDMGFAHSVGHDLLLATASWLAAGVLTNARAIAERLEQRRIVPRGRVTVIPNGIHWPRNLPTAADVAAVRQRLKLPSQAFVILAVGRLVPIKGYPWLLEALPLVLAKIPDVVLVIAGDGPAEASLRQQAAELHLGDHVRFLGHVEPVTSILPVATVFALPSLSEGLANALMEAMAHAIPVVATAVGGNQELVTDGQTGRLVPPAQAGPLAAALLEILQQPDRARHYGQAGRESMRHYSTEQMVRRTCQFYEQVRARFV